MRTKVENKIITFVLPMKGRLPAGGFKVTYEYANRLADRGWRVRVVHPCALPQPLSAGRPSLSLRMRQLLEFHLGKATGHYRPDDWFKVKPEVELLWTKNLDPRQLPASDVWVATAWQTASWAAIYGGARIYLIQGLETWAGPEREVMATWKLPLHKIVISRWLEDVARNLGEESSYIPNGLDFRTFGKDVAPEKRDPHTVAMLYHHSDWKGSTDGLQAIYQAKEKVPDLKAQIFGVPARPADLPVWVEYFQNPPQSKLREIYNRAAIFLSPSCTEGWGLPPAEALQCGAALAVTHIGGHLEYAHHEKTALLSPPRNSQALAVNVIRLLEDQKLRLRLAEHGHQFVQQFTWERAVTSFEDVLQSALAKNSEASKTISDPVDTPSLARL